MSSVINLEPVPSGTTPFHWDEIRRKSRISIQATKRVLAPYVKARQKPKSIRLENKYFSFYVQKKPSILLTDMNWMYEGFDLFDIINDTVDVMKEATKSAAAIAYMVDEATDEIFQIPKGYQDEHRISYKIGTGKTVAAHVAATKEFVNINDLLEDIRFPDGLGNSGRPEASDQEVIIKAVMCVPVLTPQGDCLAVFEFHREYNEEVYNDNDLRLVIMFSSWVGSTIYQNQQRITLQKQQELNEYLVDLTKCYFSDTDLLNTLIPEIVNFAKDVLNAQHGAFYILRETNDGIYADIWDEKEEDSEIIYKKFKRHITTESNDVLSIVINKGITLNIKNAYFDPRVDQRNRKTYVITSILCAPIKVMDEVLGAIQVMNKKKGRCFTKSDEVLIQTFSAYCGYVLGYNKLYRQTKNSSNLNNVYLEMLSHNMKPCVHDHYFVSNHRELSVVPPKFNKFQYYLGEYYEPLQPQLIMYIFDEIIPNTFESNLLLDFVLTVKECHKNRPYFNFTHTFYTIHFVYNVLLRNKEVFTKIEMTAMLIAALCCTLDVCGLSDNTLQLSDHFLYHLYEESILQNHSYHVAVFIMKFLKISELFQPAEYKTFLEEVRRCIIATDLAVFCKKRIKMIRLCNDTEFEIKNKIHKNLLKSIIMGMASMASHCKPFKIAKQIIENFYKDKKEENLMIEKAGLCPILEYDPENMQCIPKDQLLYLTTMIIPTTIVINKVLPNCHSLVREVIRLKDAWQEMQDIQGQRLWSLEESIPTKKGVAII